MMLMNLMLLMMCEFKYILLLLDLHRGDQALLLFLFVAHNEIIVGAERSTEVLVDERITC